VNQSRTAQRHHAMRAIFASFIALGTLRPLPPLVPVHRRPISLLRS
jgi:hypothetical protein